jgi:hypothetical protein
MMMMTGSQCSFSCTVCSRSLCSTFFYSLGPVFFFFVALIHSFSVICTFVLLGVCVSLDSHWHRSVGDADEDDGDEDEDDDDMDSDDVVHLATAAPRAYD